MGIKPGLQALIALLRQDYDYVSVLATDSKGLAVRISQHAKSVTSQTMTTERGIVVRVYRDGLYSEYAFNDLTRRTRRRGGGDPPGAGRAAGAPAGKRRQDL